MAFHIKQANFDKRPSAEQRKALNAMGESASGLTRIGAHLKIKQLITESVAKKALLIEWRNRRNLERDHNSAIREEYRRREASAWPF